MAAQTRILIVDDHPLVREGLNQALQRDPSLIVCGESATAADALDAYVRLKPDLVLTDISLPGRNGMELTRDIRALSPRAQILILSMHDEALYAERALRAGARGYLMKQEMVGTLLAAIHQVLSGQVYVSPRVSARILENLTGHNAEISVIGKLSDRELEVFHLTGMGRGTQEIALELHLSVKTVETHRSHIKEKLEIKSMPELIAYASRWATAQDGTGDN